jgi:hypothetical protein
LYASTPEHGSGGSWIAGGSELVFPNRFGKHMNLRNLQRRVWAPALAKAA